MFSILFAEVFLDGNHALTVVYQIYSNLVQKPILWPKITKIKIQSESKLYNFLTKIAYLKAVDRIKFKSTKS